jgi:hypothetical protein
VLAVILVMEHFADKVVGNTISGYYPFVKLQDPLQEPLCAYGSTQEPEQAVQAQ